MDESEFKSIHTRVNERPCTFAKAIQLRCADCSRAQKVLIAERESVACLSPAAQARCAEAVALFRQKALFALHMTHLEGPLPHAKEVKIECGTLQGVQALCGGGPITDIHTLLESALDRYGTLADLPHSEIVKTVVNYPFRKPRRPDGT